MTVVVETVNMSRNLYIFHYTYSLYLCILCMHIILLSINPFAAKPKLFEVIRIAITLLSISIIPFNTGKSKQFLVSKLPRITIQ